MLSRRKPPINLQPTHQKLFEHEFIRSIPEHSLTLFKNAVVTPDGVVFCEGKLEVNSLVAEDHRKFFEGIYQFYYRCIGSVVQTEKRAHLLAFDAWSFGYFHWMTDFIPRLFKVKNLVTDCVVILPAVNNGIWNRISALASLFRKKEAIPHAGYFVDSLEPFKLSAIYKHKTRIPLVTGDLYFSAHLAPTGNYDDQMMKDLRAFYFEHYGIKYTKPERLVYASRSLAPRRHIQNEAEVIQKLKTFGFEIVSLESLSFRDQVALMSQTKFMIGQHGAGLTNLLFMQDQSYVLEFKAEGDSNNLCYFSLASAMNVNYVYQFCESDGRVVQDADITVDIDLLSQNLKMVV